MIDIESCFYHWFGDSMQAVHQKSPCQLLFIGLPKYIHDQYFIQLFTYDSSFKSSQISQAIDT